MDRINRELSVIAYYLSEYDKKAVFALGYTTCSAALKGISDRLGKPNNYLKLRRDEFDVLTSSKRRGWANRAPAKEVVLIFEELAAKDFDELTAIVKDILDKADEKFRSRVTDAVNDKEYIEEVNKVEGTYAGTKIIRDKPVPAGKIKNHVTQTYARDPVVAANALCNAEYKCEVCAQHETFIRKVNGKPYTEPHHLIPMKYQSRFDCSLDVENNVISLCSNCHNKLHYGADISEMLRQLYNARRDLLIKAGINISLEELETLYI